LRAAIYIRVSTDDQVKYGYSIAEQREACCSRAKEMGAKEVLIFSDEGVSGVILERPGLNELREAARESRFQILVVRDPDRLSRKLAHQLLITEELERHNIKLEFLDFDWKDNPEGRLFYSIRGAIAEYEREKIRDRMRRGKDQKAKQGGIPINFDVFGYQYNPETGIVSYREQEKKTVINIFNWFTCEDMGVNGVAKRLNEMGIPTRRGGEMWHRQVVKQILTNTVYIGVWSYKGMSIQVPAILDENLFKRAQKKLKESRRLYAGKIKHGYLLSGLVICNDCGNTMTGVNAKWWGKRERRYTCNKSCQGYKNKGCRPIKMIPADPLEEVVWEQVREWLRNPDWLLREALDYLQGKGNSGEEIKLLDKNLMNIIKGQNSIINLLANGLVELDDNISKKLNELKSRKERLEKRKEEIIGRQKLKEGSLHKIEELREIATIILDNLNKVEFLEKVFLVRTLISQVVVSGRSKRDEKGSGSIDVILHAKLPKGIYL